MKHAITDVWLGLLIVIGGCQENGRVLEMSSNPEIPPIKLSSGLGPIHMSVTTGSAEAQKYFDQGLAYIFAFNHEAAVRSFERAAQLDPRLAMAWWGKALALGPNINMPEIDAATHKAANDAAQQARALSDNATAQERAYIDAVATRYCGDARPDAAKLNQAYAAAMKRVTRRYPQDLHAATLYAEALMDLRPWKYWTTDGKPQEGTQEIVEVLEWVLARDPNHTGANHYYIHAVEASLDPGKALDAARRLPKLAPGAGHLVHMPAHIYMRLGDYAGAIRANAEAAKRDEEFMSCCGVSGLYPALYYSHNLHFLAVAAAMAGRSREATAAMAKLSSHVDPIASGLPAADGFGVFPLLLAVRQAQWGRIARWPEPAANRPITLAAWCFARAMADASTGKVGPALEGQTRFIEAAAKAPDIALGNNTTTRIFAVAKHALAAKIAAARGDAQAARGEWEQAVKLQDEMAYDEPPPWPWPVRESLGAHLLRSGDAEAAEKVFRKDLERNLNNPRSIFGLAHSLKVRGKHVESNDTMARFEQAWKDADGNLSLNDF